MRILSVKQLKDIQLNQESFIFPLGLNTKIILDKKRPSNKKEHQLVYQQDLRSYGSIGDCCNYLSNKELLDLEKKGMIEIRKSFNKTREIINN